MVPQEHFYLQVINKLNHLGRAGTLVDQVPQKDQPVFIPFIINGSQQLLKFIKASMDIAYKESSQISPHKHMFLIYFDSLQKGKQELMQKLWRKKQMY